MKRIISTMLIAIMCLTFVSGCNKKSDPPFDFAVSKYLELGEYVGIEYEEMTLEVTDADIDAEINYELSQKGYGEEKEVTNRPVQNGDKVNIDFEGKKDGIAFEGGTSKGYDLVIGSNSFIEGFEAGLIGAKKGQTLDLNLKFPENYGNEELNGAAVVFTVKINKITETVYPKFTDALAKELSEEHPTVEQYRKYMAEELVKYNEQSIQQNKEGTVWNTVISNSKLKSFPESEREFGQEMALLVMNNQYYAQYGVSFEDALEQSGMTLEDEQIAAQLEESAEGIIKEFLVVAAIARDQDLMISDEEYQKSLEEYATQNGYKTTEEFKKAINEKQFHLMLLNEKVTDFLMENAVKKN